MNEIEQLLPHRKPFLFVDEIIESAGRIPADAGTGLSAPIRCANSASIPCATDKIIAEHIFTEEEFFFKGHFPQYPVVPGVILIETMAQSGGAGLRKRGVLGEGALFFLATVDKVKFRRQVRPGEKVRSEIVNLRVSPKMIKQSGKAFVGDELAAEAEWMCIVG
jgi:3-hydroxyacyl-[acyl-carrier-protein] dehydratase